MVAGKSALKLLVLAPVFATLVGAVPGSGQPANELRPALRVLDRHPLRVQGSHFKARERLTVTVTAAEKRVRHSVATASGRFNATFGDVTITRCEAFTIRAVGNRGSAAFLKRMAPACLPVRTPG